MRATLRIATTARPCVSRVARPRRLLVENHSLWSLQPDPKWCYKNPDAAKKLAMVDLTEAIGQKRMCSVGTYADHIGDSDKVDVWLPVGRGIHLLFECGAPPLQDMPYTLRPYLPPSWIPWDTRQLGVLLQVIKLDHGGIHVVFEAEGTSNPLDSPSNLFVTDVDSSVPVMVDGQKMERGKRVQLKPGCVLQCGDDVAFQVLRNVFAHA